MDIVKLTAKVKTPIAINSPLHLDGLLSAVHPAMHNIENRPTRYDADGSTVVQAPLPLCSIRSSGGDLYDWVWAASATEFPDTAMLEGDAIVKRWTASDVECFRLVLSTATGALRNRLVRFPIVVTPEVYFYCMTSNWGELRRIVRRVKSIGGLRKSGYGIIDCWEIESCDLNWREVIVKDGIARRNLPASFGEGESINISTKPPYWHKSTITEGTRVGSKVNLNDGLVIV